MDIKKMLPETFVNWCFNTKLYKILLSVRFRSHKVCLGNENPDKIFYIIGFEDLNGGIFWIVNKALMHIAYATEKRYIPVVDYKNYRTQYTSDEEFGKINVWEKFFEQPAGYSVQDIQHSKNIIIQRKMHTPDEKHLMGNFYNDPVKINYFRELYTKYIQYSDYTKSYLQKSEFILKGSRVLGVLCRGTDYVILRPKNHPIPPTSSLVIEKSKVVMEEYNCDKIFLATEDEDIYEDFKRAFGDKLIVNQQKRVSKSQFMKGEDLATVKRKISQSSEELYTSGLEYLEAIYLLSKCDCFVGVRCGGAKGALILTSGFEYQYIFDLGMY